mgnify:CR=1 FL=1
MDVLTLGAAARVNEHELMTTKYINVSKTMYKQKHIYIMQQYDNKQLLLVTDI